MTRCVRLAAVVVRLLMAIALLAGATVAPAVPSETITYGYDVLGRLVKVSRAGTVNNNASECYSYDKASNRTNVTVNTAADCVSGGGGGGTTITVNPASLPGGTVGTAYSQTITASGGTAPYSFTKTGTLPTGLTLNGSSGLLSGTPSAAATYNFTVTATDSASNSGSRTYGLTIAASGGGGGTDCSGIRFSVADASSDEGTPMVFVITKTGTISGTAICSVSYATALRTGGAAGGDFTAVSGTKTFDSSSGATQSVTVNTRSDQIVEGNEEFDFNLSAPSGNAQLVRGQATGTIIDDPNSCPTC